MDAFKTPGAFSWSELMTSEPAAALRFYSTLLGWSTEKMAMPNGDYHVLKVGDAAIGGVMAIPSEAKTGGMTPSWGCYVTVQDVDATARKATELGGKVVRGPQDIPGVGRMAVIVDPQGATLNVITYAMPSD
jgi:predicted enzyme related to lactoylglutathione lyase